MRGTATELLLIVLAIVLAILILEHVGISFH